MSNFELNSRKNDLIEIRKNILKASYLSGHGHIPTCFSIIELLYGLYSFMKHNPQKPDDHNRDIFILSKGHASLAHYSVLSHYGYLDKDELPTFGQYNTRLGCHADRQKVPGVEASTGSLGHGIGLAIGMSLAEKIKRSNKKIYCLIGDGEANEGSVWEALLVGVANELNNLTIICDSNGSQVRCLNITDMDQKMKSFGAEVYSIDGHDINLLLDVLEKPQQTVKCINAKTFKGYGIKLLEENFLEWHRKSPNKETYELMMSELNEKSI